MAGTARGGRGDGLVSSVTPSAQGEAPGQRTVPRTFLRAVPPEKRRAAALVNARPGRPSGARSRDPLWPGGWRVAERWDTPLSRILPMERF